MGNINQMTPTTFELTIGRIPNKTNDETKEVTLQIFNTVIPGMDIPEIEAYWMGVKGRRDSSGGIEYLDWTFSFFINNEFSNWKTLYDWFIYAGETSPLPSTHNVQAVLNVRNNFGETILKILFKMVWIKSLGEVQLNTQSGEEFLQSTATFSYIQYVAYDPDEEISG